MTHYTPAWPYYSVTITAHQVWVVAIHDFWCQVAIAALHEIITACAELSAPVFAEKEWGLTDPYERLEAILFQTEGASRLA